MVHKTQCWSFIDNDIVQFALGRGGPASPPHRLPTAMLLVRHSGHGIEPGSPPALDTATVARCCRP